MTLVTNVNVIDFMIVSIKLLNIQTRITGRKCEILEVVHSSLASHMISLRNCDIFFEKFSALHRKIWKLKNSRQ
jgi:hypothetical protein